jgi:uncharacterized LabA/DUF88 family protein
LSKNVAVFVDVANLYYSARGQDVDVDYVALLKTATKGRDLIRAYAYSGLDPENENQRKFIDFLNKNGYKVLTKDIRKFGDGRVKANLDIELVVDLFRLADRMDIAVIVSGDGDFAPAIRALQDKGVRCEVISFRPNTSSDLIAVADEFIDIMKIIGIGRGKEARAADKVMSAPEMPAKEVVPEFGFREASPTVAAAALAALKEGKDGRSGTDRGRGRGRERARPAAAPAAGSAAAEEAAPETVGGAAPVETDAEGRRRRRRRGGRGRGRGGRSAVEVAAGDVAEAPSGADITWTEVDDLSQIDGIVEMPDLGEDREYTFEEADEATLAELGLLEPGAQAPGAAAPDDASAQAEQPAAKPRRRTRAAKPAAEAAGGEDAAPATKAGPARRTRTRKPAADTSDAAAETAGAGDEAQPKRRTRAAKPKAGADTEKPKRTSRSRSRSAAPDTGESPPTEGEAEAEGIWQRFRTARGTRRGG